jgi:hypothetical protein
MEANIISESEAGITVLPVHGQGVFLYRAPVSIPSIEFKILNSTSDDGLHVQITQTQVLVNRIGSLEPLIDATNSKGLVGSNGSYYWFSLDSQNQTLMAGIGEARIETKTYKYQWNLAEGNRHQNKLFLESLTRIQYTAFIRPIRILRDPITLHVPLVVKDTDSLTMHDIAHAKFIPKANLSTISQKLYNCISGKAFKLNTPDFPNFAKAIEYSIATPGCWCNTRLQEKSQEFSKDKPNLAETYLRITLAQNNGESPGIPYVMEIWPVGHYSPIHNHAGAEAIIRVLHGSINVSLFPYLCAEEDGVKPFGAADFKKDDITWISPTLNQTHQLLNKPGNKDTCITIQCYMYNENNKAHYDYFDYLDDKGNKQQYEPDSDMDFIDFKKLIMREWKARPRTWHCC